MEGRDEKGLKRLKFSRPFGTAEMLLSEDWKMAEQVNACVIRPTESVYSSPSPVWARSRPFARSLRDLRPALAGQIPLAVSQTARVSPLGEDIPAADVW